MNSNILFYTKLAASFLPFIAFAYTNSKANVKKQVRHRQYLMPVVALAYSIAMLISLTSVSNFLMDKIVTVADLFSRFGLGGVSDFIMNLYLNQGVYVSLILFNTSALLAYVAFKKTVTLVLGRIKVVDGTLPGTIVGIFYDYDEDEDKWFIKEQLGQARTFVKAAYYCCAIVSVAALFVSCVLCKEHLISAPFYPVFAVIVIGEIAFFVDGCRADEITAETRVETDKSRHMAMYPLLRNPLKLLFGDKLSADGTTVNNSIAAGGAVEEILVDLEKNDDHLAKNYAAFIRKKMDGGFRPNVDYVRSGYELACGSSLLFNTPFYDKLNPYAFYAMNREILKGGKVLVVLGRHGTEEDLKAWMEEGMRSVSNIPELWRIEVLTGEKKQEDVLVDVGIISRSGVHDLDIHKNNLDFLKNVSFVLLVEPSRLVTTAQIGLNLLIKCCGIDRAVTFCSVDRNCDGLVDALSHILMTSLTEVSATEYPHGTSSYMYWTADDDYVQHRILPGVSRCLGMGTELSMVALKNQVEKTVWYGGEVFPVRDVRWIAKQYYYDLLEYANLPANQETFNRVFHTSFNMCNERVNDYSYITVEDDRNNLFETRRNFATIAEKQGFINVISSEYMLREYMASNPELFTADAKAIPYIIADYARSKRNAILSLCLLLCIDSVKKEQLDRQMVMLNIETEDPVSEIWKEICVIFGGDSGEIDGELNPILTVKTRDGKTVSFTKDETILYKRQYSVESGKFESVYTIENADFSRIILDDLQNASYIAEKESKDVYIGTELKGHVYQKYMPGQFFTLNGKYYEMVAAATDARILVRRASEHIDGRLSYRQVRNYTITHLEDSLEMGAQKYINNIGIHYQYADFLCETPGYWKLHAYNDFDNGDLIKVNGVPVRQYHHKQILKIDFSKLGDAFTDSVRMTLTNLLNELFVTLFADNQPFISAITVGSYDAPLTYSLSFGEGMEANDKCIYIVEDSQLDIGLLIAVERNAGRIFQIISDYLSWNEEQMTKSIQGMAEPQEEKSPEPFNVYQDDEPKKSVFGKIGDWFKGIFKKKNKGEKKPKSDKQSEKEKKKAEKETAKQQKKAEKEAKKQQKLQEKLDKKEAAKQKRAEKTKTDEPEEQAETIGEAEDEEFVIEDEPETEETPEEEQEPVLAGAMAQNEVEVSEDD